MLNSNYIFPYRGNILAIIFLLITFTFPYVLLYPHVGSFPSEGLSEGADGSYYKYNFCLNKFKSIDKISDGKLSFNNEINGTPKLNISFDNNDKIYKKFDSSQSLYLNSLGNQILALDVISESDKKLLFMLQQDNSFSIESMNNFIRAASKFYLACNPLITDRGVTEGYWAAKGTSVLHHWVHLYESTLAGGKGLAQYGYTIPLSVKFVLQKTNNLGPTNFVKSTWIIFYLCGLTYISIFLYIFRKTPHVAIIGLIFKIFLFTKLGYFAQLIAPGFHWLRELLLIIVPTVFLVLNLPSRVIGNNNFIPKKLILFLFFAIFIYFVDPIFCTISFTSLLITLFLLNNRIICKFYCDNKIRFYSVLFFLVISGGILFYFQRSKINYIFDKLLNLGGGLIPFDRFGSSVVIVVCLVAILSLLFLSSFKKNSAFLLSYFSITTLFVSFYYFITPDVFHFIKFLEYAIPFFLFFVISSFGFHRYINKFIFYSKNNILRNKVTFFVSFLFFLFLSPSNYFNDSKGSSELKVFDSLGNFYFSSTEHLINKRLIKANISPDLVNHLSLSFDLTNVDYIISPYDKYLTFLYDKRNGFPSPDFVAWLDSKEKYDLVKSHFNKPSKITLVLVDEEIFNVNLRLGMKSHDAMWHSLHMASKLNLKGRIRAYELSKNILNDCAIKSYDSKIKWFLFECY